MVAEPAIINQVLQADAATIDEVTRARLMRLLIRALGRLRVGDERHYVLKLTSWNVRKLDVFRSAFPETPLVWLQRQPAEVIASLLAHESEWRKLQSEPELAAALFGMAAGEATTAEPAVFYACALAALLKAARSAPPHLMQTIDATSDLPQAAWTTVAPYFGLTPDSDQIALMKAQSRFYSKSADPTVFERPQNTAGVVPEPVRKLTAVELEESLYQELSGRKASKPSLRQSGVSPG